MKKTLWLIRSKPAPAKKPYKYGDEPDMVKHLVLSHCKITDGGSSLASAGKIVKGRVAYSRDPTRKVGDCFTGVVYLKDAIYEAEATTYNEFVGEYFELFL
jgi:hypothetical protein